MTIEHQLLALIAQGESLTLEFKTCAKRLNRDVYETVCAFLNRHGGTLLLGVTDSGDLTGVDPDCVAHSPFPKNPVIARFFREIGRADELGSGVRNLLKYSKAYGGKAPVLVEADIFRIAIAVPESGLSTVLSNAGQATGQVTGQVDAWILNVLTACRTPKKSSEIQDISGIKHRETFQRNYLDYLLKEDLLARTIPEKPKSPMQRYQTTAKGQQLLQGI